MTGAELIVKARLAGRPIRNGVVYVKTDAGERLNAEWPRYGEHAEVCIPPGDYPDLLDLRFAKGLLAHVEGCDAARVSAIAQAFEPVAGRVIAVTYAKADPHGRVLTMTDTQGVMTWPR